MNSEKFRLMLPLFIDWEVKIPLKNKTPFVRLYAAVLTMMLLMVHWVTDAEPVRVRAEYG